MIDKSLIGKEYPPFRVEVEKRWIRSFAEAVGDTNPIYFNEGAAQAAGSLFKYSWSFRYCRQSGGTGPRLR